MLIAVILDIYLYSCGVGNKHPVMVEVTLKEF